MHSVGEKAAIRCQCDCKLSKMEVSIAAEFHAEVSSETRFK